MSDRESVFRYLPFDLFWRTNTGLLPCVITADTGWMVNNHLIDVICASGLDYVDIRLVKIECIEPARANDVDAFSVHDQVAS